MKVKELFLTIKNKIKNIDSQINKANKEIESNRKKIIASKVLIDEVSLKSTKKKVLILSIIEKVCAGLGLCSLIGACVLTILIPGNGLLFGFISILAYLFSRASLEITRKVVKVEKNTEDSYLLEDKIKNFKKNIETLESKLKDLEKNKNLLNSLYNKIEKKYSPEQEVDINTLSSNSNKNTSYANIESQENENEIIR